jgi:hypothetical protein
MTSTPSLLFFDSPQILEYFIFPVE